MSVPAACVPPGRAPGRVPSPDCRGAGGSESRRPSREAAGAVSPDLPKSKCAP